MDALIVLFASGLISLFSAFTKKPAVVISSALIGLALTIGLIVCQLNGGPTYVNLDYEGLDFSRQNLYYCLSAVSLTFLIVALGYQRFKENIEHTGEYIGLLIFSATGAMVMFCFTDMFMFFIGLEILSIPIYVMAGSNKNDLRSNEASLKYFLMGAFATGLLLFGIAWVYGATGSFNLVEIQRAASEGVEHNGMLLIGILLILASFLFKVGAAPFHFWSPDVYDGAPHIVTAFMASVVKFAAFGAFLHLFAVAFGSQELHEFWGPVVAVLIVVTLFVGNLSALKQTGLKRLLAYSSITHGGYTLLVILTMGMNSLQDLWFYMTSYGLSIIGIIALGLAVNDSEDKMDSLKGLIYRNPLLGTVGIIALLSLAGVPPTAGFFGKYMVFSSAWSEHSWLVIIALINSGIGIYYYVKLIGTIVAKPEGEISKLNVSPLTGAVIVISTIGTLALAFVLPYFML